MTGAKTMIRGWCGRLLAASVVIIGVSFAAISDSASAKDFRSTDALMLRLMSMYNVRGAALALIKGGRIVLERGYGVRELATHAAVTPATLFNIGSISKSFTALDIAQLVDQHKVELDAPVIKYIPSLRLSDPRTTRAVTLRQLLSHNSGFPPDGRWLRRVPPTRQGIVAEFATMPITARPGTSATFRR
jgi:CubicO group peptidase (beta-lactamase class C family)